LPGSLRLDLGGDPLRINELAPADHRYRIALPVDPNQRNLLRRQPSHDVEGQAAAAVNRVKAQETDPEMATKMLNEGFLAALRRSDEKELREFARMKFESFSVAGRTPN